jgi:hypothetical protein
MLAAWLKKSGLQALQSSAIFLSGLGLTSVLLRHCVIFYSKIPLAFPSDSSLSPVVLRADGGSPDAVQRAAPLFAAVAAGAEPVIAMGLDKRYGDFNIIDEDNRPVMGHSYRVGPRPAGSNHVGPGNNLRLMVVYMRLAKCRVPAFEEAVASARWKGPTFDYCKLVHRLTGEMIDLDSPEVCAWMIRDFCYKKSKMPRSERIRLCGELHKRMILHSFAKGDNREVRKYFSEYKRSENLFLVMLDQADQSMTIADFMKKMMGS